VRSLPPAFRSPSKTPLLYRQSGSRPPVSAAHEVARDEFVPGFFATPLSLTPSPLLKLTPPIFLKLKGMHFSCQATQRPAALFSAAATVRLPKLYRCGLAQFPESTPASTPVRHAPPFPRVPLVLFSKRWRPFLFCHKPQTAAVEFLLTGITSPPRLSSTAPPSPRLAHFYPEFKLLTRPAGLGSLFRMLE